MLEKLVLCVTRKPPRNMQVMSGVCGGKSPVPPLRMHINKTSMSSTTAHELIFHTGRQSTTVCCVTSEPSPHVSTPWPAAAFTILAPVPYSLRRLLATLLSLMTLNCTTLGSRRIIRKAVADQFVRFIPGCGTRVVSRTRRRPAAGHHAALL